MAHEDHKDSSLPIEETLDKPYPFPSQERGTQLRSAASSQTSLQLVTGQVLEDAPTWPVVYAHLFLDKIIQLIGKVFRATFVTCIFAAAMEIIPKIYVIPKDKTGERDEMKKKAKEIEHTKEIEDHKRRLDQQIKKACGNLFTISHKESMEWEINLITMKELAFQCGVEIAFLQKLVDRLESGARTTIKWIVVQLSTGVVVIVVLCYWVYVKEEVETGTTVKGITAALILGVTTHCIRKAQVLLDNRTLVSECEQVKNELEKPMMACLMYKHSVEDTLPEKKKILHVVDREILKCKND